MANLTPLGGASPSPSPLLMILGLVIAAAVLALTAWAVGAFDRGRPGRHSRSRPQPAPWVNLRYRSTIAWLARNEQAQAALAEAQRGGER